MWKLRPMMLLLTLVLVVLAAVTLVGLVVTGPAAESVGNAVGLGSTAVLIWGIAKWPIMLFIVDLMVALLYYSTPNVKQPAVPMGQRRRGTRDRHLDRALGGLRLLRCQLLVL